MLNLKSIMYEYVINVTKGEDLAEIYFPDLDESYSYNRQIEGSKYDLSEDLIEHAFKVCVKRLILRRRRVYCGKSKPDWQTELRIKLSNWFFQQDGLEDFSKIAKKHKLLTGYTASASLYEEFFDTEKEMDLSICFDIVHAFQIPLTIKSMEVEIQ